MKLPCPKCLAAKRDAAKAAGQDTQLLDIQMSIVCNKSPLAPHGSDPCCCGADWIPDDQTSDTYYHRFKRRSAAMQKEVEFLNTRLGEPYVPCRHPNYDPDNMRCPDCRMMARDIKLERKQPLSQQQELFFVVAFHGGGYIQAYVGENGPKDISDPGIRVFATESEANQVVEEMFGFDVLKVIRVHRDNLGITTIPE